VRKATDVFTPNDVPTITYVERATHKLEDRLSDAMAIPKMIISLSGPSKSGKTVLVNKVFERENLIAVSGASIKKPDDLWDRVLDWMDVPSERTAKTGSVLKGELGAQAGGKLGIPFVAEGKADAQAKIGADRATGPDQKFQTRGLQQVVKEIAGSSFTVFVDDFHYIDKEVQKDLGRQIKEAAEAGVRICTASVPHRSDDVVRSNPELRGRVAAIDTDYWSETELAQIGHLGFRELNIDIANPVLERMTGEAFGSPQLMQAICLNFCLEQGIKKMRPTYERLDIDLLTMDDVFERTSTQTDFSSLVSALHSGPKQRGIQRRVFELTDGTKGDVYRCVLLAIKSDPPQLSFSYDAMLQRTAGVCIGESPSGSSVAGALAQMSYLAKSQQEAVVIEWDENVLDIVEPYFLFFLRGSSFLQKLGHQ
jgi:hypothetical protein